MKRIMAVFTALLLLAFAALSIAEGIRTTPAPPVPNAAEGTYQQFAETRMRFTTLGKAAAYVLDDTGNVYLWPYDETEPSLLTAVPVANSEMFLEDGRPYGDLPQASQEQINETVSLFAAADDGVLYAVNRYAGRLGTVDEGGVHWYQGFACGGLMNSEGHERVVRSAAVMDNALYLLVDCWEENPAAWNCTRVMRIDLISGETTLSPATEADQLCPYQGRLLLLCASEWGQAYLMIMDPSGGCEKLTIAMPSGEPTALAWDGASDAIYVATENCVYRSLGGADFEAAASMPANYVDGCGQVTQSGRYAFSGSGIWAVSLSGLDSAARLSVRLHSTDPTLKALFTRQHPDVLLDWRVDYAMTSADVAEAIRGGDTTTAVFSVKVDSQFGSLVDKGYAAPITNPAILDSVERMYPTLAAPLKNERGEVIAYPWDFGVNTWAVNPSLWSKYFADAELPTTWKDFFLLMQAFDERGTAEGDLFLMDWDYEAMLERVLISFILRQHQRGEAVDFTDPVLAETLTELNKARQLLLDRGVETYAEAEIYWSAEVVGDHSVFHYEQGNATRSIYLWNEYALTPFVFAEGDTPVYPGNMRVLIINPSSGQKELAEAFLAQLTDAEYGVMNRYILHSDATEPYTQRPYNITGEVISRWQTAVSSVSLATHDPLQSDAFIAQARLLMERYAAGQLNERQFLSKLNETARMIESE